jgi:hypothetical protein
MAFDERERIISIVTRQRMACSFDWEADVLPLNYASGTAIPLHSADLFNERRTLHAAWAEFATGKIGVA